MSQFYARYIPPTSSGIFKADLKEKSEKAAGEKRNAETPLSTKKNKKRRIEEIPDQKSKASEKGARPQDSQEASTEKRSDEKEKKRKGERAGHSNGVAGDAGDGSPDREEKHSQVFSRFDKSRSKSLREPASFVESHTGTPHIHESRQKIVQHDLAPIPQPELKDDADKAITYSTLPEWQRNPIRVKSDSRQKFSELALSKKVLANLKTVGKTHALPVQSAVLPLLSSANANRRPDLCVAAATGSGKTYSYVLPILESLKNRQNTALRAVVVVPTRALVKQVSQTFEECGNDVGVVVSSVDGSRKIEDEQRGLVEDFWVYDPEGYDRDLQTPIDWDHFSFTDVTAEVLHDEQSRNDRVGYVRHHRSKIDVLIATPGRVIEHLQSTKGFTLDYVEWFIADEADRLLNESYNEWLQVVLPALRSQEATAHRDRLARQMQILDVPRRRVTKVLLSATMTNNLTQLLRLELSEPRLIVVESSERAPDPVADRISVESNQAEYQLPDGLIESAVALKDGENKPLYLLEVLDKHVFTVQSTSANQQTLNNGSKKHKSRGQDQSSNSSVSSSDEEMSDAESAMSVSSKASSLSSSNTSISSSLSSSSESSDSEYKHRVSQDQDPTREGRRNSSSREELTAASHPRVLIFVRSTEAAHRLCHLLSLLRPSLASKLATFTRSSTSEKADGKATASSISKTSKSYRKILASFSAGTTPILIGTDLAARGLDIAGIAQVINYDVPASAMTYVHRVGRTARAGRSGHAWTLVEHQQGKWFWEEIGDKGKKRTIRRSQAVHKVNIVLPDDKTGYEAALAQLSEDVLGK